MADHDRESSKLFTPATIAACLGAAVAAVIVLLLEGHRWWCKAGDLVPWSWDIWSMHMSQHLIDPYSFTHFLHGILWFWLAGLLLWKLPMRWRFVVAFALESAWEMLENSPMIIDRYRTVTISLDYFGDSILNSLSDIAFCSLGFYVATKLGNWRSLFLFIAIELILLFTVRDNLTINIIMLFYPIDAIKHWQMQA